MMKDYTVVPGGYFDVNYAYLERNLLDAVIDVPFDIAGGIKKKAQLPIDRLLRRCNYNGQYYLAIDDTIDMKVKAKIQKAEYTMILLSAITVLNWVLVFKRK